MTSVAWGGPLLPPREGLQHQGLVCVLGRAALCWDEEEDGAGLLLGHVCIPCPALAACPRGFPLTRPASSEGARGA